MGGRISAEPCYHWQRSDHAGNTENDSIWISWYGHLTLLECFLRGGRVAMQAKRATPPVFFSTACHLYHDPAIPSCCSFDSSIVGSVDRSIASAIASSIDSTVDSPADSSINALFIVIISYSIALSMALTIVCFWRPV